MRAISPKTQIEEQPQRAQKDAAAQISLRAVTGLEVASVIVSVLITVWVVIPLLPSPRWVAYVPGGLALALIINSNRVRGERLKDLGFTTRHFFSALRLLILPTLLACSVFVAIGWSANSFHRNTHFWSTMLFLPFWGIFQQYILQGFIYRRVRFMLVDDHAPLDQQKQQINLAIVASSAIFAFVHLPNPALTILTLVGGLFWSWIYERAPNLIALGLSHALMSLMLITSLPPWLLESMSIGYKHFLYQKF
jgi:membrane protease YdiL (CAAX protease family)